MLRIAVISSLILAACDVGEIPGTGPDGGGGGSDSGSNNVVCETINATPPDGNHNPGLGCRSNAGCHNAGTGLGPNAPEWAYAGTIYKDQAGTMPYAGATIFVTLGGTTQKAISATNGNFWIEAALLPGPSAAMTGTTKASACPDTMPMATILSAGGGDCNNCHRSSGGTTFPVYVLPPP